MKIESSGPGGRPFERCAMGDDSKTDDVDETPEYPLPSPTDPLRRDQLPLEEDDLAGDNTDETSTDRSPSSTESLGRQREP